ncbi:sensor histidine kinase [Clostridium zeae]|nr:sensor histidine kinase [Clostridium zeae]
MIIFLILAKDTWWNNTKYILVWSVIIVSALGLRYGYGIQASRLLWPMVWILGTLRKKYDKLSIILAVGIIGIIILITYPSGDIYNTFLALLGIFLGIRSIRIRREAYQTSNLHLQELNEAHRELQQAHMELQEASVHSMRYAALEERARLAREIHDGIGHQLTSLIVQLQALEIMMKSDPEKAGELVAKLLQISKRTMAEVRLAVKEWSDDEMGLGLVALKGLVSQTQARSSIKFDFYQDSEVSEWPVETSIVLYRILQESITNILRHSNAESVEVRIKETGDKIVLSVSDDGQHKGDIPLTYGFGMKGIIERCEALGGFCNITPEKPHGLRIEATLPSELKLREE